MVGLLHFGNSFSHLLLYPSQLSILTGMYILRCLQYLFSPCHVMCRQVPQLSLTASLQITFNAKPGFWVTPVPYCQITLPHELVLSHPHCPPGMLVRLGNMAFVAEGYLITNRIPATLTPAIDVMRTPGDTDAFAIFLWGRPSTHLACVVVAFPRFYVCFSHLGLRPYTL